MKVLIVDDNPVNQTLMSRLVERDCGAATVCAGDGPSGLAAFSANDPDVVVVDYMMPGMDGVEFIGRVRTDPGSLDVPILMVTADGDRQLRHRALRGGATDFLTKPVDPEEFGARVGNMLRLSDAQRALRRQNETLAEKVERATAGIIRAERETLWCLARVAECRDPETGSHVVRMAHYSKLIAEALELPSELCERIFQAAPLHDVGKISTPDGILLKPGRLTEEEFIVMKQHCEAGWKILHEHSSPVLRLGAEIALAHHEKYDGSGYPNGLAADAIPLHGRIVAVADVFDALVSPRPYKRAWSAVDARAYLEDGRGGHFDPSCVDAFLGRWAEVESIRESHPDETD